GLGRRGRRPRLAVAGFHGAGVRRRDAPARRRRDQRTLPDAVRLAHRAGAGAPAGGCHRGEPAPARLRAAADHEGRPGPGAVAEAAARRVLRRNPRELTDVEGKRPRLVLTCGEPAGIGPDICLAIAAGLAGREAPPFHVTCLTDRDL